MDMVILLVALAIAGGSYLLLRTGVKEAAAVPAPGLPIPAPVAPDYLVSKLHYSVGDVLIHNETGQKVTIMKIPSILDKEHTIKWPGGELGKIHKAQLISWFTRV